MRQAWTIGTFGALASLVLTVPGCPWLIPTTTGDGPIAEGISGVLGEPMPSATAEQLATFERGKAVSLRRFAPSEGLGPAFNVTFCGGCHEKPVPGGSAGLYRNFNLAGRTTSDGAFIAAESAGPAGGVIRLFDLDADAPTRPEVQEGTTIFAQRNPIPFFGAGLIAELPESVITANADPDDADGDGISGRVNIDRGFVGRFGRKSQTVSIEGFIRGPLFNHLGITTNPLSDAQRAALPVDSSLAGDAATTGKGLEGFAADAKLGPHMQAAAPDGPNFDDDGVPDPEMSTDELFDLISFSMLLAIPEFDELTEQGESGRQLFRQANCHACHVPRLEGPRGPLPLYSDLLLHDMGEDLADGVVQGLASGSEFRTQPLWGIAAVGPYLHDGRASTLEDAILAHAGEAQASRDVYAGFSEDEKLAVEEFLLSLGGRSQATSGLVPPDAVTPGTGEYGGPVRDLTANEMDRFERGMRLFDHDFSFVEGVGGLTGGDDARFNGDSCRACHFDPVLGGAGPLGLNVLRHGSVDGEGNFTAPSNTANTILHKLTRLGERAIDAEAGTNLFERRQTPHVFGTGLVEAISDETILANEDVDDSDADGISGRANRLGDGRIGRFGWKADVPSVAEFVRDAMAAELGLTVGAQPGLTFGITGDDDGIADPELSVEEAEDLAFFMRMMAGPPRSLEGLDPATVSAGEALFASVGCSKCHIPSLDSSLGQANLYSDLLLHDIMPAGSPGVTSASATETEFRTAPLWGVSRTAPYFHDGSAETLDQAVRSHAGEAEAIRAAYEGLSEFERAQLLTFLSSL